MSFSKFKKFVRVSKHSAMVKLGKQQETAESPEYTRQRSTFKRFRQSFDSLSANTHGMVAQQKAAISTGMDLVESSRGLAEQAPELASNLESFAQTQEQIEGFRQEMVERLEATSLTMLETLKIHDIAVAVQTEKAAAKLKTEYDAVKVESDKARENVELAEETAETRERYEGMKTDFTRLSNSATANTERDMGLVVCSILQELGGLVGQQYRLYQECTLQ